MKISYNWLKDILNFELDPLQTEAILTDIGLEVERIETYESIPGGLKDLVIGEVKELTRHPNADRLNIAEVNVGGKENYTIVCGAPNVKANQKVVVALPGTTIYPTNGEAFKIKNAKIRGVASSGMICAEDEIGLGSDHEGILVLDKKAKIGIPASEYFGLTKDTIFEIGLTPNRADAMSHYGVARDLMVALKYRKVINSNSKLTQLPKKEEIKCKDNGSVKIEIHDQEKCYRYTGLVLKNISVKDSPKWLKIRLESIGVKSINNIVDITNYVLHYLGQPLHAFDLDTIEEGTIKVRCPKQNTSFTTLDETQRKLDQNDLMICNNSKEMCIAGVFGGLDSGVNKNTKNIFIESALFNPVSIRKTAKRHGLNTDASFRYERGVDPEMVIPALLKATRMVIELAGGEVDSNIFDVHPVKSNYFSFEINFENIRKLCGFSLSNDEMTELLNYLEIKVENKENDIANVTVPNYRNDVTREVDIAEEVLRIYGFNNILIPEKINSSPSFTPTKNHVNLQQKISNHLASLGCFEALSNSLTKSTYVEMLKSTENNNDYHVNLLNPLSNDTAVLRQSLIYNILEIIKHNQHNGEPNCKLFEWGKTYQKVEATFIEKKQLVIGISGLQNEEHWFNGKQPSSFFQLKGIVESIFKMLGISCEENALINDDVWEDGISYSSNKKIIAKVGAINPILLSKMGLKDDCYTAELSWDTIVKLAIKQRTKFKTINKHQKVYRDLSILIDENISMNALMDQIKKTKSPLLKDIQLFDIYRDEKTMKGKKAYGLRFQFLHAERTLKDKEVDKIMNSIQNNLVQNVNATLR